MKTIKELYSHCTALVTNLHEFDREKEAILRNVLAIYEKKLERYKQNKYFQSMTQDDLDVIVMNATLNEVQELLCLVWR